MTTALIGRLLVLLALGVAAGGAIVGIAAARKGSRAGTRLTRHLATAFALSFIAANAVMIYALVTHDFSVSYVARVGSLATPTHITIVSLWSSLEGSILFWAAILAVYVLFYVRSTRLRTADPRTAYTLGITLLVGTFFALLIAGPANPFLDTPAPIPADGPGPNPLLQNHILMIVHPPMLYLGYVGMTIPAAMAAAALLAGRLTTDWTRSLRRWMLVPWGFLTAGIILGGWWAYEVLGWGGYWGWDPVENASLLPWLTATAFVHTAMLQERRGLVKGWTLALVLVTFALTILGTFMTRSGVFNSVHSFTQSPIGPTFLIFLAVVVFASILLLALRLHTLEPGRPIRSPLSREAAFIVNNLLLVALTFAVLLGTTYPLVAEAFRGVKVSVGGPFFSEFAAPIGVALLFLMGIGPALPWGASTARDALARLALPALAGALTAGVFALVGFDAFWTLATTGAAGFAAAVALRDMAVPVRLRRARHDESWGVALRTAFTRSRRRYGGLIVHVGVAVAAMAIAVSSSHQQLTEGVLRTGDSLNLGEYRMQFEGSHLVNEPHRQRQVADMTIYRGDTLVGSLEPAMNRYATSMNPIGTPAVLTRPAHDLYLSLMYVEPGGGEIGLRVFLNPGVVWLWLGAAIMLLGCAVAAWPRRGGERLAEAA